MSVPPPVLDYSPHRDDKHARRARVLAFNHPGLVLCTVLMYAVALPCCGGVRNDVSAISALLFWAGQGYFALRLCAAFWTPSAGRLRIAEDLGLCVGCLIPIVGLLATGSILRQARGYLHLAGYHIGLVFVSRRPFHEKQEAPGVHPGPPSIS